MPAFRTVGISYSAVLFLCLFSCSIRLLDAAEVVWIPIPPGDLALKDNPDQPGASAMILYKQETRDHQKDASEFYYRIKIFREEGMKYADIEIPYVKGSSSVKDLAAHTVQPDGSTIEFRGAVYDKVLVSAHKFNYRARAFTLPEVQPGSIIEYRYRIDGDSGGSFWPVQESLFIREAKLLLRTLPRSPTIVPRPDSFGPSFVTGEGNSLTTTLPNIPAFQREALMPPESQAMRHYYMYYVYDTETNPYDYWRIAGEEMAKFVSKQVGDGGKLRPAVQQLVSAQDPPEVKLRKLYAAIQTKVRNLSYEESFSKKERKLEGIKERKSALDVWSLGYGSAEEITTLFVAMCRAAGMKCDPIYISRRDTHFFDEQIMDASQLDGSVAVVNLPEGPLYLDPGTRSAPFGLLAWPNQNVNGFTVHAKESEKIILPPLDADENHRRRQISVELEPNGDATIKLALHYTGQVAISRRNDFYELSDKQREYNLRQEFEDVFPTATIESVSWKGLDDSSDEVQVSCTLAIPNYAMSVGSRLLVQPLVIPERSPLPHKRRNYNVYFPFPYTLIDEVRIVPPAGFEAEQLPASPQIELPIGQYQTLVTKEAGIVVFQRKIVLHASLVTGVGGYQQLKTFLDGNQDRDQAYVVFSKR